MKSLVIALGFNMFVVDLQLHSKTSIPIPNASILTAFLKTNNSKEQQQISRRLTEDQ